MSFGLNQAQIIGRLGADVSVTATQGGRQVATLSIASDESYVNRNTGEVVDRTEWHRVVTFQDGVVEMLRKHGVKGRLVYVQGKLQTRRWRKDGETTDRYTTEVLIAPGGRVQFLEKRAPGAAAPATASGDVPADDIPF